MVREVSGILVKGDPSILTYIKQLGELSHFGIILENRHHPNTEPQIRTIHRTGCRSAARLIPRDETRFGPCGRPSVRSVGHPGDRRRPVATVQVWDLPCRTRPGTFVRKRLGLDGSGWAGRAGVRAGVRAMGISLVDW